MPTLRRRTAEPSTSLRPTSLPRSTVPGPAPWLHRRRHPPLLSTLSHPSSLATLASRRGPSQHKGEPENHAQALEASPSRALTRANQTHGTPRPHHPPAPSAGCCASGSGRDVSAPNGSGRPELADRAPGADAHLRVVAHLAGHRPLTTTPPAPPTRCSTTRPRPTARSATTSPRTRRRLRSPSPTG